jgi:hypothetical protein
MALTKFGFIVSGKNLDPANNTMTMTSPGFTMIAVGVSHPEEGIRIARGMVEQGVQLIELCGGFGPKWTARILESIDGEIPVGSVSYGPESIDAMHVLFRDSIG